MLPAMYSGVSGLMTHQERMNVIGNDVANVNTVGFKQSDPNLLQGAVDIGFRERSPAAQALECCFQLRT